MHIDGYADATGDPAANVVLSRHRAEAVRGLLMDAGVAPAELRAKGHGAAHAAAGDNRSDRRIEFSVQVSRLAALQASPSGCRSRTIAFMRSSSTWV